ncbi:MAG: 7-cyano-7-deazaguanine synthase, partial [Bacteroidota bacterium]
MYALVGAVVALLHDQSRLHIYENGVGAINLTYRGAVGLDHSRSVHPLLLLGLSRFLSDYLNRPFAIENPFLFTTKAQMLEGLDEGLIGATASCDSPLRSSVAQCGSCSSCVLRRQSIAAAGLRDGTTYAVSRTAPASLDTLAHAQAMSDQAHEIGFALASGHSSDESWEMLARTYPDLDDIVDRVEPADNVRAASMRKKLLALYRRHVADWDAA